MAYIIHTGINLQNEGRRHMGGGIIGKIKFYSSVLEIGEVFGTQKAEIDPKNYQALPFYGSPSNP